MDSLTGEEERREQGEAFWINVRMRLDSSDVSLHDKNVVNTLAGGQKARGWMSMIPIGLVSSYRYLYDCVKGLGCEDADIIERDVLRTVGAVKDGPGVFGDTSDVGKAGKARAMHRVLTAISITDSMGYCQGMNYVVDFLLKMVSEEDAFCLFLYALRNKHLCCLYETKLPVLSDYMEIYERQLTHRLPDLAQHLKEHGFIAPFYSIEWFTTLFVLSCPFDLTVALWDLFFMGAKDVQVRCAVALMESIEPSLMLMGTEELLKNFRTVALYQVDAMDVVLRALKLDLGPVKVGSPDLYGQPTANGVNQENHNYSTPSPSGRASESVGTAVGNGNCFLIDPRGKVREDEGAADQAEPGATAQSSGSNLQGDILLTLRLRYLRKAREAMQERDVTTGRWAQEQLQRGHELQLQQQKDASGGGGGDIVPPEASEVEVDADRKADQREDTADEKEAVERLRSCSSNSSVSPLQKRRLSDTDTNDDLGGEAPAEGDTEFKNGFTVNSYFEFLVDGELMGKAYALKEVVSSCDRITQWAHLNQRWADCLECMESKLSQYNMADHMLRYAITINAHIRVISFFLAVAGADPNSQDRWLRTPLHFAAVHNRPDVVRVLLLAGADSSIPGALNKSLLIAPTSSSVSGALKSGRMVTPTVLCQATYGNSLASVPASLLILRGKACILCNTLEATSLASVAKRRHSRIMNTRIPNMQVQAAVRTGEAACPSDTSSTVPSGKVVISNCQKCNIPMCAWCLPDHHCIYDIIQEEFTWKVNLVQAARAASMASDSSTFSATLASGIDGNSHHSKKGSKALRRLGKVLFSRRPSMFGTSPREKDRISHMDTDDESDNEEESDSDRSRDSCSTASGELVSSDHDLGATATTRSSDSQSQAVVPDIVKVDDEERVTIARDSSSSADSGFDAGVAATSTRKKGPLEIDTGGVDADAKAEKAMVQTPARDSLRSIFRREGSFTATSPGSASSSPRAGHNNSSSSSRQLSSISKKNSEESSTEKTTGFSDGLKKMRARMSTKKAAEESVEEVLQTPKGGMPMYWIGYRDEANRQATLQPWQIILLPLVQGGEYNRVVQRSGSNNTRNNSARTAKSSHGQGQDKGQGQGQGQGQGRDEGQGSAILQVGPDSDDESDADSVEVASKLSPKVHFNRDHARDKDHDDDLRVCDEEIHRQVREIYQNSGKFPSKKSNTYTRRKEPKYLHFVSEMEGLYKILERDATEIFAIEPLPAPPPMITSVSASYLHVKHHRHHRAAPPRPSSSRFSPVDTTECPHRREEANTDAKLSPVVGEDKFDSWDGVLMNEDGKVWVDSLASVSRNTAKCDPENLDSPLINSVPAFRSITAFSTEVELSDKDKVGNNSRRELELTDKELRQRDSYASDAEARFQQQLQIKGMNGLKKDAVKRFLAGAWQLSEEDAMWVPDDCAWYCRKCSEQFSLFRRKHHCRRCGNVFCDEDAPRVEASECVHESLQQAYVGVIKEEYGKKKEKIQFRLCTSCKNEIRHSVGLYIELDFLLPRYNFSTWLISLLSKTYNNMCQTSRPAPSPRSGGGVDGNADLKNVRLKKFAVAGHWMDSMADWLWRDRQLQLDNT